MSTAHALNDGEVDAEMEKLISFIQKDAKEKAQELKDKADEEFNINKGKIVTQESKQIDAISQRKIKQAKVQKKIAQSNVSNKARLQLLSERETLLNELFDQVKANLGHVSEDKDKYQQLLESLLLQSFLQLMEHEVSVLCRETDVSTVEVAMDAARQQYEQKTGYRIEPVLDHDNFLPSTSTGGVVVSALAGRIKCENTLESRLDLLGEKMLPDIRIMLFGPSPSRKFYT